MKIAVVHDILVDYGGSERVLREILKAYPKADLFTFFYNGRNPILKNYFGKRKIHTAKLDFILPLIKKHYTSFFKPIALLYFYFLDLKGYDLVISSSHSYGCKIVNTNANTKHISYVHTVPKFLYEEYQNELAFIKQKPFSIIFFPLLFILRKIDLFASKQPDVILTNSMNIQSKIKNIYNRNSEILYPPFNSKKIVKKNKKKFYVAHSRLVKQKGFELIIEAFNKNGEKLVVVGTGYLLKPLKKKAKKNIRFLGWQNQESLEKIYSFAKALVYAAYDEDLGMVPIESMLSGVPVIGYYSGGVKETIFNNISGIFFYKYNANSLNKAITLFEEKKLSSINCINWAKQFKKNFISELKSYEKKNY